MAEQVNLPEIAVIEEISGWDPDQNGIKKVNTYLDAGWVLVSTYTSGNTKQGQNQVYCLGWLRQNGEPLRPQVKSV